MIKKQFWRYVLPSMIAFAFSGVYAIIDPNIILYKIVTLSFGLPVAVFERQGKVLRVFDASLLFKVMCIFAKDFSRRRVFVSLNRLIVKEYSLEAIDSLVQAGFKKEMQDYVLFRD